MTKQIITRTGLGQKAHRFVAPESTKPLVIAGIIFEDCPGFHSRSDGDVVFHALCNAISSLTGIAILSDIASNLLLKDGITDSEVYLKEAIKTLQRQKITHVAISLEAKRPRFQEQILPMRQKVAQVLHLDLSQVGITAVSGAGLSDYGCGDGVNCLAIITTQEEL